MVNHNWMLPHFLTLYASNMAGFKTSKAQNLEKDFGSDVSFNPFRVMTQLFLLQCFKLSTHLLGNIFTNSKN